MNYTIVHLKYGEMVASEIYHFRNTPHKGDNLTINLYTMGGKVKVIKAIVESVLHTSNDCILTIALKAGILAPSNI